MTKDISSQDKPATSAMSSPRVLIAAGGTGGHVYPAIAIADALKEVHAETEILFIGTKDHMEWDAVPKAGYDIKSIWISGFHRRFTLKNILFPVKLGSSLVQSWAILSQFEPDVVVSCGGFASGPVGWVASKKDIPLVLQEQNSYPGVTNRLLAKKAGKIFTAFKHADRYLPPEKTEMAGNPTRKNLVEVDKEAAYREFGFDSNEKTLLVLGGSGGARSINEAMAANIEKLHNEMNLQIIWQCGSRYYDELHIQLHTDDYEDLRLVDFLHNMPEAYAVADLVVSRAGALSCSELALTGKPSILIPSPNVAGDHQSKNARSMVDEGAAAILDDSEAGDALAQLVEKLIFDQQKLKEMQQAALKLARPDAAGEIAREILEIANKQVSKP
ncbi:MAG TPA: undecaprenyldiphospho-muramoylpentapeptide beta-N-acetylglucosaminyltransferase [Halalkalibaculum sp.]|nr:undecaprenyldiphospho-muramoylpentapeptide beta-N-acetylglucosaminyltransferase [Halalkalibaculum sp.]